MGLFKSFVSQTRKPEGFLGKTGLEKCFGQVAKVLKPGGYFLVCNESDGTDATGLKFEKIIDGMKCHTVEEIESALKNAGFSSVKSGHHKTKPWITVIARRNP